MYGNNSGSTTPSFTITLNNTECEINQETESCSVLTFTSSDKGTATSISTNADHAFINVNGTVLELDDTGDISFSSSATYHLYLAHNTAGPANVHIKPFTFNNTVYEVNDSVSMSFIQPNILYTSALQVVFDINGGLRSPTIPTRLSSEKFLNLGEENYNEIPFINLQTLIASLKNSSGTIIFEGDIS